MIDIYKKILSDKGSEKAGTVNNPLSFYLVNNDNSNVEFLSTNVIPINLLLSGRYDGGIPKGRITMISAPSKYGKTFISLPVIRSAQKKGMTTIVIDTERRFPFKTAEKLGIDISKEKLMVLRENGIEEVKTIILKILDGIPREERQNILFVIDSWGTLVSSKTIEDGLVGKDVKDMTLTQKKNDLANIILNTFATYFVMNHVYDNTGGFGDPLAIPGGRRLYFNASSVILCTSRAKDKDKDKNINGYIVTAKSHKGDFCKEDAVIEFRIKTDGGLDVFYGLKELAMEAGVIENSKPGWFIRKHIPNDTPVKEDNMYTAEFWIPIFKQTDFGNYLKTAFEYNSEFDIVNDEEKWNDIDQSETETQTQPELLNESESEIKSKKGKK